MAKCNTLADLVEGKDYHAHRGYRFGMAWFYDYEHAKAYAATMTGCINGGHRDGEPFGQLEHALWQGEHTWWVVDNNKRKED